MIILLSLLLYTIIRIRVASAWSVLRSVSRNVVVPVPAAGVERGTRLAPPSFQRAAEFIAWKTYATRGDDDDDDRIIRPKDTAYFYIFIPFFLFRILFFFFHNNNNIKAHNNKFSGVIS